MSLTFLFTVFQAFTVAVLLFHRLYPTGHWRLACPTAGARTQPSRKWKLLLWALWHGSRTTDSWNAAAPHLKSYMFTNVPYCLNKMSRTLMLFDFKHYNSGLSPEPLLGSFDLVRFFRPFHGIKMHTLDLYYKAVNIYYWLWISIYRLMNASYNS